MFNKRGQTTLFVIIAILIVATVAVAGYFSGVLSFGVPIKIAPVQDRVTECIADVVTTGAEILGEQGGYITLPEFQPGNEFAPFTSQFNFFGSVMPYWFYLSANGQYKEQVPSIRSMESQLEDYLKENIVNCNFEEFLVQGYSIEFEEATSAQIDIREGEIFASIRWPVNIEFEGTSRRIASYDIKVDSTLGKLYNLARDIYSKEKSLLFLEDYTIDVLSLYAPGTDVELTCSPLLWSKEKVTSEIKTALEANIPTVRLEGDYYRLSSEERDYYVTELGDKLKGVQVNFVYDDVFPTKIEIDPSSNDIMRADPIGNQEGLGVLGFCYVPYHFIYTVTYPVLVQVFDEDYGLFQFPMVVSVENNLPRGEVPAETPGDLEVELCEFAVQDYSLEVIDLNNQPVEASISFKCSGTVCSIGETEEGEFDGQFPQCVNGFAIAKSEGYADASAQISTNEGGSAVIIMKPKHELPVRVLKDLKDLEDDETALLIFSTEETTESILYPTQDKITLVQGNYKVTTYLFKEGRIVLQAQSIEQCINVPREGVFGFLGFEREDCFTISQPAQELNQLTIGGGTASVFLSEEDLEDAKFVGLEIGSQPIPKTVFDLQDVYNNIFASSVGVSLR